MSGMQGMAGMHGMHRGHGMHGKRQAWRAERFAMLDSNGDGAITADEFNARVGERVAWMQKKRLHVLDKDGDGKVSSDEFTARAKQRFADNDLDSDGKITAADLPPGMADRWTKHQDQDADDETDPETDPESDKE